MHTTTRGIVLREVAYKESDKILTVLTSDLGKRTVKARGCLRRGSPLAAASQLLVWSDMTLFEYRDYYTMQEASSIEQFWNVRGDIEKLALGSYFADVIEHTAEEGEPENGLLSLLLNSLYALDALDKPLAQIKAAFEMRCACLAGYTPSLEACAVCGAPEPADARLSLTEGVLHCGGCRGALGGGISAPLSQGTLAALRHITECAPGRLLSFALDEARLAELSSVCEAFLATQLERGFRTLDFYKQLQLTEPAPGAWDTK